MKIILFTVASLLSACFGANNVKSRPATMDATAAPAKTLYDFKMKTLTGEDFSFVKFKGKKVLLLNVASKCGYTPQYADWEKFYEQQGEKVVVVGIPADNFGGQEPGSNAEIAQFCKVKFGVKFPMMEKVSVKGSDQHPLYQWLTQKDQNGWNTQEPTWNFCKYLINEKGELVKFFGSAVKPDNPEFLAAIK